MRLKYNHSKEAHNMISPRNMVPHVLSFVKPNSVVDIGCGLGTFIRAFKENGIDKVLGLDGAWAPKTLLFQNIEKEEFKEVDLEKPIELGEKFDLAVCLEVAEHISPDRGPSLVKDICRLSDIVLFGAAIPFQGGDNHINERWPTYWIDQFEKNGYEVRDILRSKIWNQDGIYWWYKQNSFFFVKKGSEAYSSLPISENHMSPIIHPELFTTVVNFREKNALKRYARGFIKSITFKIGLIK